MRKWTLAILSTILACGCVTTKSYNARVAELDQLRADDAKVAAERESKLKHQIADLQSQLADTNARLTQVTTERDGLRKHLDDTTALTGELKKRLEKLGQNVDKLASEKARWRRHWRTPRRASRSCAGRRRRRRRARRRSAASWRGCAR
jgi:chromosome segregation ATPase